MLPSELEELIEQAAREEWEELDLSGCDLKELLPTIGKVISLKKLILGQPHNKLNVPKTLFRNQLVSLPEEICKLTNLQHLDLSNNKISTFPEAITNLTNLQYLDLRGNDLNDLPETIVNLTNLQSLDLRGNSLVQIPKSIASLTNLQFLDLAGNNLDEMIESFTLITSLKDLQYLDLDGNFFNEIPVTIAQLKNLRTLKLSFNSITKMPEAITRLTNLQSLDLSVNNLSEIPEAITRLFNLQSLNLSTNEINEIPETITRLTNLQSLDLANNIISEIPEIIVNLTKLRNINFGRDTWERNSNNITEIPEVITRLSNLQFLDLSENNITEIPEVITRLTNLQSLNLSFNSLSAIPDSITRLQKLTHLNLDENPITEPPLEVVKEGIEAIRQYFKQIETEGIDYLYEAKLLIVGEGGAGKTTLANKIINPDYELCKEDSTKGIEIKQWKFPLDNGKTFTVNIWDFGGQEIYHATHQYFLTKRSLYALVADNRKEDTDFYYWLNVIELLSGDSPIAIIKNEIQKRKRDINLNQLRGEFGNLKDSFATNLADNGGLDKILENFKFYLTSLPHIGSTLPKTWVKVRTALESDPRNHITLNEYLQICKSNGFKQDKDSLQLSEYLHDLGICLHFQDDKTSSLYKTVILKPKWGTESAYAVLDHPEVIDKKGHFSHQDLDQIWSADDYAGMQPELLQLMMKFQLCYEIPLAKGNYIAPQLLSENQPDYTWDESDNLILRYTYDLMPKGLVRQFIVAMHQDIEAQNVWRTGVIINAQNISNTRAEIIESYGKREIKIRISGKNKRDLLTVVTRELDKIHDLYPRFKESKESKEKYQKLVPCNCNTCKGNQNPHFYPYATLREFLSDRQLEIQCQKKPYNMVNVRSLLDDIGENERQILRKKEWQNSNNDRNFIEFKPQITVQPQITIQQQQQQGGAMDNQQQQQSNSDNSQQQQQTSRPLRAKSAWANGLFYLFLFVVVIGGIGYLAGTLKILNLIAVIVAGIVFIPLVGALQLRQDDRLSEKNFMELVKLAIAQLPLIGNIFKK